MSLFNVSVVSVIDVVCQRKVKTSHGYYDAVCSGRTLKFNAYYNDTSEKYFVSNYLGDNNDRYYKSEGVYAGHRNASQSWSVGTDYANYAHVHHYTVNLIN